jgi:hypothetical protein
MRAEVDSLNLVVLVVGGLDPNGDTLPVTLVDVARLQDAHDVWQRGFGLNHRRAAT